MTDSTVQMYFQWFSSKSVVSTFTLKGTSFFVLQLINHACHADIIGIVAVERGAGKNRKTINTFSDSGFLSVSGRLCKRKFPE